MADRLVHAAFEREGGVDATARNDALRYFYDVALSVRALATGAPATATRLAKLRVVNDVKGESEGAGGGGGGATKPDALLEALDRVAHETVPLLSGGGGGGGGDDDVEAYAAAVTAALESCRGVLMRPPPPPPRMTRRAAVATTSEITEAMDDDDDDDDDDDAAPSPAPRASTAGATIAGARTRENVARVKMIFPDHGDGYVAAALAHFGDDPDACVGGLLDGGDLPNALKSLPTSTTWDEWVGNRADADADAKAKAGGRAAKVRPIHWSPYDRVGVVNADP